MAERFQKKKLNKEDHKNIDNAANGVKTGLGALGALGLVGTVVIKYGKPILKVAKNILIK